MRLSNSSKEKTRDKIKRGNEGKAKGKRGTNAATQALLHKMGHAMKWDQVEKNWEQYKAQVKKQWKKIPDHDLVLTQGKQEELRKRIQQNYKLSRPDAEAQMQDFLVNLNT